MDNENVVRSVVKAMDLLNIVTENSRSLSLNEITQKVDMPKTTVYRLLNSLVFSGYLGIDINGNYETGPKMLFTSNVEKRIENLKDALHHKLIEIRDLTGETVNLGIMHSGGVLYIDSVQSKHSIRLVSEIGSNVPVNITALGKILMFGKTDDEIKRFFRRSKSTEMTSYTIMTVDEFVREVRESEQKGYALDNMEFSLDCKCIAIPVYSSDEEIIAAISVSGVISRVTDEYINKYSEALLEISKELRVDSSLL